jgi:Uma2 family endonuclease
MSLPAQPQVHTVEEYLRRERDSHEKHEYRDGEIVAMAGASPNHVLIATNLLIEIGNALKGQPCRVYTSDLKVASLRRRQITYPDGSIICGSPEIHPAAGSESDVVTNPRVLIEVLSPSTEHYDRTTKFDIYRDIPTFEEYVLVEQRSPRIETYRRFEDGSWRFQAFVGLDATATIAAVGVTIPLSEVYASVTFEPLPGETST